MPKLTSVKDPEAEPKKAEPKAKKTAEPKVEAPPKERAARTTLAEAVEPVNGLWYGDNGTGKTTDLASMANLGKVLFVNAEAGIKAKPLKARGVNVDNIVLFPGPDETLCFEALENLFWEIKADLEDDPLSWVGTCWDSITEIYKALLDEIVAHQVAKAERAGKSRDRFFVDRADYGVMTEQLRLLLRRFRDLPCHFAVAALERRELDDDGSVAYRPAVTPALQNDLMGMVDIICHTSVDIVLDDDEFRGLFRNQGKYRGKDRIGTLPVSLVDPTFDRVYAYINEDLEEGADPVMIEASERSKGVAEELKEKAASE